MIVTDLQNLLLSINVSIFRACLTSGGAGQRAGLEDVPPEAQDGRSGGGGAECRGAPGLREPTASPGVSLQSPGHRHGKETNLHCYWSNYFFISIVP